MKKCPVVVDTRTVALGEEPVSAAGLPPAPFILAPHMDSPSVSTHGFYTGAAEMFLYFQISLIEQEKVWLKKTKQI